jgi:hypothetical protein
MGLIIHMHSVVVRVDAIKEKMKDGVNGFKKIIPHSMFSMDEELIGVYFMTPEAINYFATSLYDFGLAHFVDEKQKEQQYIAFTVQGLGLVYPCSWIDVTRNTLSGGQTVQGVRLKGSKSQSLSTPYGWTIERHMELISVQPEETINAKKDGKSYVIEKDGTKLYTNPTYEPIDSKNTS